MWDDGFAPTTSVSGDRILIVGDTFTSGARTQSAASALQLAGARVVAILPIGRVVDPEFSDAAAEL
jgi:orotate phosphoribosyltransferase